MNSKFYELPLERQKQIINGALKVFAESNYRKASTIEIALEAGISKGLLFHYFVNKKELYLFLYKYCVEMAGRELEKNRNMEETDFFEILVQSQFIKCNIMKEYRHLYDFLVKVYLETESEITNEIEKFSKPLIEDNHRNFLSRIDKSKFKDGVDINLLLKSLQWCSDGFMRSAFNSNSSIDEINCEFKKILEMYKKNFYREGI